MTTLTDRYAWAVVRLLPEEQRHEVEQEIRSLVADMVDARAPMRSESSASGSGDEPVERQVLVELGDPALLAARYVEEPRALISAQHFPEYVRVLKLVAAVAVPAVTAVAAAGAAFGDDSTVGDVVGSGIGAAFNGAVQVAFWVTLVYAFADRWKADSPWTPDALPDVPATSGTSFTADTVLGIVFTVLTAVAMIWQHVRPPLDDEAGVGVPVLHPDLWDGPGQLLLALLAASLVVPAAVLVRRGWSGRWAVANAVTNLAFLAAVAWAALGERLINPRFLEALAEQADFDQVPTIDPWIPIVAVAAIEVWDAAAAFIAARRSALEPAGAPT